MEWLRAFLLSHHHSLLQKDIQLAERLGAPAGFTLSGWFYLLESEGNWWGVLFRPFTDSLWLYIFNIREHCKDAYGIDRQRKREEEEAK